MHLGQQLIFLEIFLRPGHLEHYYKAIQNRAEKTGRTPKVVAIRYLCYTAFLILWVLPITFPTHQFIKKQIMIHYSCDRCKTPIDQQEFRYIVKIQIQATIQNGPQPLDEDRDHLVEIEEILDRMDDEQDDDISDELYQRRTFDLCPGCYKQYSRNPLAKESVAPIGFSQN